MNQPDVIEASETINASSEKVWSFLMDVDSWQKWWSGHRLKRVEPAWQKGANLIWERGNDAIVFDFKPLALLDFGGTNMGMEIHRYFRLSEETGVSKIVYGFLVNGGDIGEKNAERQKMAATLKRLKEIIEGIASEQSKETQETGSEEKSPQRQASREDILSTLAEVLAQDKRVSKPQDVSIASLSEMLVSDEELTKFSQSRAQQKPSSSAPKTDEEFIKEMADNIRAHNKKKWWQFWK